MSPTRRPRSTTVDGSGDPERSQRVARRARKVRRESMLAGHRLIITEKPSVAKDVARVLGLRQRRQGWIEGDGTRVTWCLGHLVELVQPATYRPEWRAWRLDNLPMLPDEFKLEVRDGVQQQWQVVRKLLRDDGVTDVVNACDAGREGELIFAYAYDLAKCRKPVQRLWISSMTDASISAGFKALEPGDRRKGLQDAARCRSEADWLVGLNATRAMTTRLRVGGEGVLLSVGRVQTPTLALLGQREDEVEAFESRDFWQVKVKLEAEKGQWDALWTRDPRAKKQDQDSNRFWQRDEAEAVRARLEGKTGTVCKVTRKKSREKPPLLYDLPALQQAANKRYGFTAKYTLELAQALYERHKVLTYPRTDSRHLTSDQVEGLPKKIESLAFGPYQEIADEVAARWPVKLGKRVVDDAEVSDHHAIIPTGVDVNRAGLSKDEKWLFNLVARRFLAVFMPDAVFAVARIDVAVADDHLLANGRTCLEPGWRRIDPPPTKRKERLLPPVEEGEQAMCKQVKLHQGKTRPPKHHTEATLLAAMESAGDIVEEVELKRAMKRNGLGTAATRAAVIETLLTRRYVERKEGNLRPTEQGRALLRALPVEELRSPKLTGQWEARLVAMAENRDSRDAFMTDVRALTTRVIEAIRDAEISAESRLAFAPPKPDGAAIGSCPSCREEIRQTARGWRCSNCTVWIPGQIARRTISPTLARELLRDGKTKVLKGFKSRANKPFSASLRFDDEHKVSLEFADPDPIGECPACGKPVRTRGSIFTCDTGRDCAFVVFGEMSGKAIDEKMVVALIKDGKSATVSGFKDRQGKPFDGFIRLDSDGRVRVGRAPSEQPAQPKAPSS